MTKMMKPLDIVSKPLIYKGFRNCRTSALSFRQKASSLFHALYCAFLPTAPQDIVVCPPSGLTRYCNPLCNVPLILCLSPLCLDHILCPCHLHTPPAYSTCILHLHLPRLGLVSAGRLSPRCPLPRSTPGICHSHDGAPLGSIVKCSGRISSSCPYGSIR